MTDKLALTVPAEEIEPKAMEQIEAALKMTYLKRLAIMPDVHAGYDLPIGGVALLDGHIWPGAVGYDIGCGMCHVNTGREMNDLLPDVLYFGTPADHDKSALKRIQVRLNKMVPVGHFERQRSTTKFDKFPNASRYGVVADAVRYKASMQLGTLGGGNHFIEIGVNKDGIVGVTIHSGSRRPGWLIGDFYMRMTDGPVPLSSKMGQAYVKDMKWALDFALANRAHMMRCCLQAMGLGKDADKLMETMVNENHNHAEVTKSGVLHRKGATPAKEGQLGIIPANMKDGVWITRGLGNTEFLSSASHGAGRAMSRKDARKLLDVDEFANQMEGIVSPVLGSLLDEAPGAYKDIHSVIAAQDGILVDVVDHFKPVFVMKG